MRPKPKINYPIELAKFTVFCVIVWAIGTSLSSQQNELEKKKAPFKDYISLIREDIPTVDSSDRAHGYVRGKIVTVDGDVRLIDKRHPGTVSSTSPKFAGSFSTIDWLFLDLDEALQASSPNEVGTVVCLSRSYEVVRTHKTGETDTCVKIGVVVIDKELRQIVTQTSFVGEAPGMLFRNLYVVKDGQIGLAGATASEPRKQIIEFLNSLPRIKFHEATPNSPR